ncbi:MAG: glucosamine-6-phosphate deaminase [Kiritimatiellae bacterium]|nr:glucosamine-6-phosphate deaminase [Kiritimatiellia bacterium]
MEVIIQKDEDKASLLVARLIAKELKAKPSLVLGLATGRTMERVYAKLVQLHREEGLDFSLCRTFNLDEYVGLESDHQGSYHFFMKQHLFSKINIDPRNTHLPNGMASDLAKECEDYERLIADCGGIDLQLLGIGSDGHIGFNEPLSALRSRTREKALAPATIKQNGPLFESLDQMPKRGLTMGVGTIQESKHCLLLATGKQKAAVLARAVEGPITSMISATALQLHPHCCVVADEAAASKLQEQAYYRWIFENEPEWDDFH